MHDPFSFNREFDYIRLDGLSRTTGRPPHEWDLYILKELIDNALDADEGLWQQDITLFPSLAIRMEYIKVPPPQNQQLLIRVANRARFPVELIPSIFATHQYVSHKAFIKGLTRGALGNALKTLLGIPYALHHHLTSDWKPEMKALSLRCGEVEYLPRYRIDMTAQTVMLECEQRHCDPVDGTEISIGVDYFVQERARTLAEIEMLAQHYHLCNPHTQFTWVVEIDRQHWKKTYAVQSTWTNKFREVASVQWYSLAAFKQLLGALYREQCGTREDTSLSLKTVCSYFAGFNGKMANASIKSILDILWQQSITKTDIDGLVAEKLYQVLVTYGPSIDASGLGCIGKEHVCEILSSVFPIEDHILYQIIAQVEDDGSRPFVIEVAVARLHEGKRHLWTAINFAPTYNDPFLSSWLHVPSKPGDVVLGLRGLLDAYGFHEDNPCILFLHLICPDIEHNAFSKAEINHQPFEKTLCEMINQLLTTLKHNQKDKEEALEGIIFNTLDSILNEIGVQERFVFEQLIERLRIRLGQDQKLAGWLNTPEAVNRLRSYINNYQQSHPVVIQHIASRGEGFLDIPLHPDHYFSLPVKHISQDLLTQHHVNKILYIYAREIEPVVIDNDWLCQMDMALLRNPSESGELEEAILQCSSRTNLPFVVLHDADESGQRIVEQMRTWLRQQQPHAERIIDLGLHKPATAVYEPTRLVELMPGELACWLLQRLQALNIAVKFIPSDTDIRQNIGKEFVKQFEGYLLESMKQYFELAGLTIAIDHQLVYTHKMKQEGLDEQIKLQLAQHPCAQSYTMVLEQFVEKFIECFMGTYRSEIKQLEQEWFQQRK